MEQIKFYLDEHIPAAIAEGLKRRGVDVLTVQEAARAGLPDSKQLAFARSVERVIVTMDSDFLVLSSKGVLHAGIAYVQADSSIGNLIQALILLQEYSHQQR
jgi:hypothetical protein